MIDETKMRRHERRRGRDEMKREDGEKGKTSSPKCDRQINKRLPVTTFNPLGDCSI